MGQVALTLRIMPESADVDIDALVKTVTDTLPAEAKWNGHEVKPFAFGLKAIEASVIMEDIEGGPDAVTDGIGNLDNVSGVEILDMGRLL